MLARDEAVAALTAEPFDVLVVGGGITGAGVALDAATRGYSVALVERADYAIGTSSRSSKLVHGGLRYLQNFDLGLVREALLERQLNVALAPHLVRPLPLVVPAFDGARPDRLTGIGLNMYDVMSTVRRRGREDDYWSPARHRVIGGDEVRELLPALDGREPSGGYLFYDCQTDDVRLVLTVLAEAVRFGAVTREPGRGDRRCSRTAAARAVDLETGGEFEIRAENVVNATGVWADRLRPDELHDEAEVPVIRPSRGTHIIVPRDTLPVVAGAIAPAGGGRTIFVLPWLGQTLIGTTDNDYEGDLERVRPSEADVEYLLDAVNAFFAASLTAGDIAGAYAGVRPLISTGDPRKSVDISRKAELYETSSGMITITGGKLTTWRRMAKMTVDRIVEREGRDAPCRTHQVPLGMTVDPAALPRVAGVDEEAYAQLAGRYGHVAHDVLRVAAERPQLAEPIQPGCPTCWPRPPTPRAASRRARSATCCCAARGWRSRRRATCARPAPRLPGRVAAVLAAELGWDAGAHRARGGGVPGRGGGRGRRRRLACATSSALAGCHLPMRLTLLTFALLLALAPAAQARWFPLEPVDSGDIQRPVVDLALEEGGGLVYVKAGQAWLSRLSSGRWTAPAALSGAGTTEAAVAAGETGRLAAAWIQGGIVYGALVGAPAVPLSAGGGAESLAIEMGVNGVAYAVWAQNGDVRAARLSESAWQPVPEPLDVDPARAAGAGALRPKVAVAADGSALVVWGEVFADGVPHVFARRIYGTTLSALPQDAGAAADSPEVDIEFDRSYAWVAFRQDVAGVSRSFARRLRASTFEAPFPLDAGRPSSGRLSP